MLLEMTAHRRKAEPNRYLWLNTANASEFSKVSATAFKAQFLAFLNRHPKLKELDHRYISRAGIRVSGGVLRWFETGGDTKAAAAYLGNSVSVALNSYVPKPLQEILHRREIRRHQNLLILCSTSDSESLRSSSLPNLSTTQISQLLDDYASSEGLNIQELDQKLFGKNIHITNEKMKTDQLTFVLSAENIAILKLINESVSESMIADPDACPKSSLIGNQSWFFWRNLWLSVSSKLTNSIDRGHREIFQMGIDAADSWCPSI
jgi:hypothetical protein